MKAAQRRGTSTLAVEQSVIGAKHLRDSGRVLYKRRWLALPAFFIVFLTMAVSTLRETPKYQGVTQLLIENDAPAVAIPNQTIQAQEGRDVDAFQQTQYRILQSRSLAKRTLDALKPADGDSAEQSVRISQFLDGLSIAPVKNTGLVEIRYSSTDPAFAAAAANALANAYIEQHLSLLQQTKETGSSAARRATSVRVVDHAEVPGTPLSPNVGLQMTFALVAGLGLAIGLAFGFEYMDDRITTPQELKSALAIPFLGMVPSLSHGEHAMANPLLTNGVPQNFSEAFKTVRTNVLFSSAKEGLRSLVITSAGPAEGKSLVASNLAIAMAQADQRVLLIDADMRRPRVHEIFGGRQEPGLSNVLAGDAQASEASRKSTVPGLWLMHSGDLPPNPAELLGSRRYSEFMASLGSHFDWVVLDTPPVMVVTDSSVVAHQASGVLFVVDADSTSRQAARAAVEQLDAASARVIGSVLNKVDLLRNPYSYAPYYRKDYARYYVSSSRSGSAS